MWFKKKKVKDFVPPLQEQKEVLGDSMKELLDGRLLADTVLRKNIGFILFLTFWESFISLTGMQRRSCT